MTVIKRARIGLHADSCALAKPNSWCAEIQSQRKHRCYRPTSRKGVKAGTRARGRQRLRPPYTFAGKGRSCACKDFSGFTKYKKEVDIGCIKCKITIAFLKGCFKFAASSLKQFVSFSQSLRRGSVLYLRDVQFLFFMFLLLPQTSFFSTSRCLWPNSPCSKSHTNPPLLTPAPVSLLKIIQSLLTSVPVPLAQEISFTLLLVPVLKTPSFNPALTFQAASIECRSFPPSHCQSDKRFLALPNLSLTRLQAPKDPSVPLFSPVTELEMFKDT